MKNPLDRGDATTVGKVLGRPSVHQPSGLCYACGEKRRYRHCRISMLFIKDGVLKKYGSGRSVVYIK